MVAELHSGWRAGMVSRRNKKFFFLNWGRGIWG